MKFAVTAATFAALVSRVAAQSLTINSLTNVVVCQPILISWSGGAPPYWVTLVTGDSSLTPIKELVTNENIQSFTWKVDQPIGTLLDLQIRDSTGATNNNAPFTVQSGSDTSCLTASSSDSATPSSTDTAASSSSSEASSAVSSASSAVSSASSAASSAVSSASSAASSAASSSSSSRASSGSASASTSRTGSASASATSSGASASASGNSATTLTGAGAAGFIGALAALVLA